jgi:AcrR family transcriptional regulator
MANSTPRSSTPNARGDRSRAAILKAAISVFAENGYRGASIAAVANAAGTSQAGLLHHFPSKERLLLALLDHRYHEDGALLNRTLTQEGLGAIDALEALVEHNESSRELVQLFTVLVGESVAADHPAREYYVERYAKVRARLLRSLRQGQQSGEIRADVDLEALVPVIVAAMDGLQIQWLLDPEVDMEASFSVLADLLTAQLRSEPPDDRPEPG